MAGDNWCSTPAMRIFVNAGSLMLRRFRASVAPMSGSDSSHCRASPCLCFRLTACRTTWLPLLLNAIRSMERSTVGSFSMTALISGRATAQLFTTTGLWERRLRKLSRPSGFGVRSIRARYPSVLGEVVMPLTGMPSVRCTHSILALRCSSRGFLN